MVWVWGDVRCLRGYEMRREVEKGGRGKRGRERRMLGEGEGDWGWGFRLTWTVAQSGILEEMSRS